jgi:F0F1-type ATP synthase delta subunit
VELKVTTSRGLEARLQQHITELFKGDAKNVIINQEHDPTVIGGVLVETDDKRLDLTVRRQLQRLKEMGV